MKFMMLIYESKEDFAARTDDTRKERLGGMEGLHPIDEEQCGLSLPLKNH